MSDQAPGPQTGRDDPTDHHRSWFDVRPLDPITSIKTKFAFVIVIAVAVSAAVSQAGFQLGIEVMLRPPIAIVISLLTGRANCYE